MYLTEYETEKTHYWLPCLGLTGMKMAIYNEFVHINAKICFNILNKFNLNYYVFAGTSIGCYRNKKNIPWADDYDIIIFESEIKKFVTVVISALRSNGFICKRYSIAKGGYQIYSKFLRFNNKSSKSYFQIDVFYTKTLPNGIIKNLCGWGLYNSKNITYNMVHPPQYCMIDDLNLPFFNNMIDDITMEYGDVINKCVIHIAHECAPPINTHFQIVYDEFDQMKAKAIENTINYFSVDNSMNVNNIVNNIVNRGWKIKKFGSMYTLIF